MKSINTSGMRRTEIRRVLDRHRGSKIGIARTLGVSHSAVSVWLRGRTTSARIAAEAEKVARELVEAEQSATVAA